MICLPNISHFLLKNYIFVILGAKIGKKPKSIVILRLQYLYPNWFKIQYWRKKSFSISKTKELRKCYYISTFSIKYLCSVCICLLIRYWNECRIQHNRVKERYADRNYTENLNLLFYGAFWYLEKTFIKNQIVECNFFLHIR